MFYLWDIFRNAFVESSVFPHVRVAKTKSLKEVPSFFFRHLTWNTASLKIFVYRKILRTYELCRLRFTYADRQLIPWRLSAASEESEMRAAGLSLVNRNLIAEEVLLLLLLEKENESRKRETYEREEDEETGDRVGRSSGRGRGVRRPVGGRESKKKRNDFGKIKRRAGRRLLRLDR